MQIKLFTISIYDDGSTLDEMNNFLKANKVLEVEKQFFSSRDGAHWCFCVRYIERSSHSTSYKKAKVDYKQILDEITFQKFSRLREIRKKVAADEGIPAFGVFNDEEIADLSRLETITQKNMLSVKGIGDKKVERFSKFFLTKVQKDETTGKPD